MCRHGDHRALDRLVQRSFGPSPQRLQDLGRNLDRRTGLAADPQFHHVGLAAARLDLVRQDAGHRVKVGGATPHQALDRRHGIARLARHQEARLLADQNATGIGISHHRRYQCLAGIVVQRRRHAIARDRHHGVGRAEIDADRQRCLAGMRQGRFARLVDLQQTHAFTRCRFVRLARASSANLSR